MTTRSACSSSAGWVSFSRNPLAPARSARKMYSSSPKLVRITTRTPASRSSATICLVASRPSSTGIWMSTSAMSGRCSAASATACCPSAASATTSMSSSASSSDRMPLRISAWSSASRILIMTAPAPGVRRAPGSRRRAAARPGAGRRARSPVPACRSGPARGPPTGAGAVPGGPCRRRRPGPRARPACSAGEPRHRPRPRGGLRWSALPARSGRRPGRRRAGAAAAVPVTVTVTGSPAARARATRLSSWLRPLPSPSSALRSTLSVARSSLAASVPASWIASSAGGISSPRLRARCTATPAWTWMTEMLCVRESCSSRAMRSRSSMALRRAASSLVRSASSARCSTSRTCSCHMRNVTTMTPAEMSQPAA